MNFLYLNTINDRGIFINISNIVCVEQLETSCCITLSNNSEKYVINSYDSICSVIESLSLD